MKLVKYAEVLDEHDGTVKTIYTRVDSPYATVVSTDNDTTGEQYTTTTWNVAPAGMYWFAPEELPEREHLPPLGPVIDRANEKDLDF